MSYWILQASVPLAQRSDLLRISSTPKGLLYYEMGIFGMLHNLNVGV